MPAAQRIFAQRIFVRAVGVVVVLLAPGWLPGLAAQGLDGLFASAIEQAQPKMVKVYGAGAGRVNSFATGVVVSDQGDIVTIQGVFLDGDQVRVALADGQTFGATVIRRNRRYQLALLKIDTPTPNYFRLSDSPVGQKGDWVMAISNAFMVAEREEPMSVNLGIISLSTSINARLRSGDAAYAGELVLIDAITSNPGSGGGAVVTRQGELVGTIGKIITSSDTNTRLNYAVPSFIIKQFVSGSLPDDAALMSQGGEGKATLGLELFTLGGRNAAAYIDRVQPDGPAAAIGLRPDDLVISLAGEKTSTIKDFDRVLQGLRVGAETIIVVRRGNSLIRTTIVPAEKE